MVPEDDATGSERAQTDESLRDERHKADRAIEDPSAIDQLANDVVEKARARADAVLAAARRRMDRSSTQALTGTSRRLVETERHHEDEALLAERARADETVQGERAEHAALLQQEREATDRDLSRERDKSDRALATRDEFLGMVSHDLRSMLQGVAGFAALIMREETSETNYAERVVSYAQRIHRAGARMNHLVGDLVDLASIHAGTLSVTKEMGDPVSVVTEAVETLQAQAAAKRIALTTEIADSLPQAAFDAPRLLQVLVNLLSNAIKFTQGEGAVTVHAAQAGEDLCFSVRDSGVGIPEAKRDAIFERYVQVASDDRRGVGLGLYISKCIVLGHGGRIWVESVVGEGSTFSFVIPLT